MQKLTLSSTIIEKIYESNNSYSYTIVKEKKSNEKKPLRKKGKIPLREARNVGN